MTSFLLFLLPFFLCIRSSGSSELPLPHIEVSKLLREDGDARLEKHSPQMYEQYTAYTYDAYKAAFLNGNTKAWEQRGFTCLNPHAKTYGGMGNLLISMLGIQFFAVSIGRTSIVNNALLTDMFDHPDPRQKLAPLPNKLLNKEMKHKITAVAAVNLNPSKMPGLSRFDKVKFIGSHGVPTLSHAFKAFSPFVPKLFPPGMQLKEGEEQFYNNLMCQGFASWLMARPSKRIEEAVTKYKENFINKCDTKNVPDIAIQVRTVDNINEKFSNPLQNCYVSCSVAKARAVQKDLQRDICIFVTSNRVSTTDSVVESLSSLLNPTGDTDSPYKFLYHQMEADRGPAAGTRAAPIMHSGKLVEAGRHLETFPLTEDFSLKEDLMDWFLLGEAVHVIGSLGSTFLATARLRIGNSDRHIFNPLQHDVSPMLDKGTDFKCHCELHSKACG